jgi:hypothetical protein
MARTRMFRRRHADRQKKRKEKGIPTLDIMAILMLADADDDEEEVVALTFLKLALDDKRERERHGTRYGRRGLYNRQKSKDFFDLMLYQYSDRWFKAWLR